MISSRFWMILVAPLRVFGIDAVQAHAQAVFDHGHGVVAEAAEGAQVVHAFVAARAAVGDVLNGGRRRLAEDTEVMVVAQPLFAALSVFAVVVVCPGAGRRGVSRLRRLGRRSRLRHPFRRAIACA